MVEDLPAPLDRPTELEWVRTIARPDTREETAWFGRFTQVHHEPATGRLFAPDIDNQHIVELSVDGKLRGQYGRRGEGPGEIKNLFALGVAAGHVVALDIGNGKIVVFDRSTQQMAVEVGLDRAPRDITTIGDTLIAVMPGTMGALFELVRPDGRSEGSFGDGAYVAGTCSRCSITYVGNGLLAVLKPAFPEGRVYRLDGTLFEAFAFMEVDHVLSEWREEFLRTIRRVSGMVAAGSGGRVSAGKLWVSKPFSTGNGSFFVTATPENLDVNARELWQLDFRGRVTRRYVFDRPWMAYAAGPFPTVYSLGLRDQMGIHEYVAPGISASK